jgi:hypothetical protein
MTVAELIDLLKTYDPAMTVLIGMKREVYELKGGEICHREDCPIVPLQSLQVAAVIR